MAVTSEELYKHARELRVAITAETDFTAREKLRESLASIEMWLYAAREQERGEQASKVAGQ